MEADLKTAETPTHPEAGVWETRVFSLGGFQVFADRIVGGSNAHIVLLHGLGGNRITWRAALPLIADAERATVYALDLPGFGATRCGSARTTLSLHARIVRQFMTQVAPRATWHIYGNSLGGLLGLKLARDPRLRIEKLVLASLSLPLSWGRSNRSLDGIARLIPTAVPYQGRKLVAAYVSSAGVPRVVDDPVRLLFADPGRLDRGLREQLIELSHLRMAWAVEAARAAELTTLSLGLALLSPLGASFLIRRASCPVVSVFGDRDPLYPLACWEQLMRVRPDWRHHCLKDVGHVPQLEVPREFVEGALGRTIE